MQDSYLRKNDEVRASMAALGKELPETSQPV